jgi:uncharacterized protein YndB with AHSA1/START domain
MTAADTLTMDFELHHPPEKVWRALTDPVLLSEWLLPVFDFKLESGAAFRFQTQAFPGWDGAVNCRFIEIEPGRKLRYTWSVPGMDTIVTFTLTPTQAGTRLSLLQSGFQPHHKREFGGARYGWASMGAKLSDLLERLP